MVKNENKNFEEIEQSICTYFTTFLFAQRHLYEQHIHVKLKLSLE